MKKIVLLLIISVFCQLAIRAQNIKKDSIKHDGITRYYQFYVPAKYNSSQAVPLVFNLHGLSSNSTEQMYYGNFMPIADTANFIIVAPDGTFISGSQFWNVGIGSSDIDDVGFISSLIDSLSLVYNIDPNRIFSTGMSNGGFMSYYLACHSNRFTAIASVTGTMTVADFPNCTPTAPVPVMEIHGTTDNTVPYGGSAIFKAIEDVVNYWVGINKCNSVPAISDVPDINTSDGATAKHYVYSGGTNGSSVEFFKVINGGHTWPGSAYVTGTTCEDFSASKEIWRFFRSYYKNKLMQTTEYTNDVNKLKLYPNPVNQSAVISWQLTRNSKLSIKIYDVVGREIQLLTKNEQLTIDNSGKHTISFNADKLKSGIYFVNLKTDFGSSVVKFAKE